MIVLVLAGLPASVPVNLRHASGPPGASWRDIKAFSALPCFDSGPVAPYHAPAMANPLLVSAPPDYLAQRKQVIESVEKISTFGRLAAIVDADLAALTDSRSVADWRETPVSVLLEFGWADAQQRWPKVKGQASVAVPAVCQRCLDACEVALEVDIDLLLIKSTDTRSADDALEIWELEHNQLRPIDVVEEMLVMAMPLAAMHTDADECAVLVGESKKDGGEATNESVRPFAELKDLFKQSH